MTKVLILGFIKSIECKTLKNDLPVIDTQPNGDDEVVAADRVNGQTPEVHEPSNVCETEEDAGQDHDGGHGVAQQEQGGQEDAGHGKAKVAVQLVGDNLELSLCHFLVFFTPHASINQWH